MSTVQSDPINRIYHSFDLFTITTGGKLRVARSPLLLVFVSMYYTRIEVIRIVLTRLEEF